MSARQKLQVDLADPDDLRAKVRDAEEIWEEKKRLVKEAQEEADHWADLVGKLKEMAGIISVNEETAASDRPSPAQDAVVRIVRREKRPMRPVEVAKRLKAEGHEVTSNAAVNAALYAAAQAGRLRRPEPRRYAPPLKKAVKKAPRKKTSR